MFIPSFTTSQLMHITLESTVELGAKQTGYTHTQPINRILKNKLQ